MKGFACLVATFLFLGVANALDCYTCDSNRAGEEYCSHVPFKKPSAEKAMSCSDSFNHAFNEFRSTFQAGGQQNDQLESCVKQTYSDEHGKVLRVTRGCATGFDNVCKFFGQNPQNPYKCYECKENYCNGANSLASAILLTLVAIAFSFKM
ncbi:uncharacterized protein LOC135939458 [Cloeon dipterum]|uniref:uncharacterized protein LOC135939458 n=1 Tax=Cloeon dipterum TaxID=197152 RepID=UPI00321F9F7B